MGTKVAIHEVIQQAMSADNIELIDVPVPGEPIVLLRVKTMPEFAFVVWVKQSTSTLYQMRFKLKSGGLSSSYYPIVCACCSSEMHGLKCPFDESQEQEREAWKKELAERFRRVIVDTCQSNGIKAIFMRRADQWRRRYGNTNGLKIVEGKNYEHAYQYLYGRRVISQALEFIDRI